MTNDKIALIRNSNDTDNPSVLLYERCECCCEERRPVTAEWYRPSSRLELGFHHADLYNIYLLSLITFIWTLDIIKSDSLRISNQWIQKLCIHSARNMNLRKEKLVAVAEVKG